MNYNNHQEIWNVFHPPNMFFTNAKPSNQQFKDIQVTFSSFRKQYCPQNKPYSTIPELNRLCSTAFCFHFMFILCLQSDTSQSWLQHLGLNTDCFNPTQSGPTLCVFYDFHIFISGGSNESTSRRDHMMICTFHKD